jgi:hypothetical protein
MNRKPTILAVTHDNAALRQVRLVLPFSVLKERGYIQDYAVTNTCFDDIPSDFTFDVLWLQRIEDSYFVNQVVRRVGHQFVYDLDDLLLASPSYVKYRCEHASGVADALRSCGVVTVTSQRLINLLERYSGYDLAHKAMVCPNGSRFATPTKPPTKPVGILWSSSDYAALTTSRESVFEAFVTFATRHELPIYCFGYVDDSLKARFPRVIDCGFVSFWHHKFLLLTYPTMIGVAPLETHADRETLDFINGKSDIKLVDFVGFGHACVCSQAPPYVDTDLAVGTKVENTAEAWIDGLEEIYAGKWKNIAREQETVIANRSMEVLAAGSWLQAIHQGRMESPISVNRLMQPKAKSVRGEAFAVLKAGITASPRLLRLKTYVPRPLRSAVKRFLCT